jgi:hypothetical protein
VEGRADLKMGSGPPINRKADLDRNSALHRSAATTRVAGKSFSPRFCIKRAILPNEPTDFGLENSIYQSAIQWVTR